MFKLFIATLLTLSINTVGIQKSQAAVGGVVALFGAPSVGGGIALAGLGVIATGFVAASNSSNSDTGGFALMIIGTFGLLILDEQGQETLSLDKVTSNHLKKANLSESEITAIKNNQEELEAVFTEAMKDRHVDLAAARFEEAKAILGEDAITGLHKLLATQI